MERRYYIHGDFRNHGYKGKLLPRTLDKIGKVDLLITEGTTLSREQTKAQTEVELVNEIATKTKSYNQVLVLMSTTNIDRVTTLTRVANRTKKAFIHDILLDNVLQLCTSKIPNGINNKNIGIFMPSYLYHMRNKEEYKPYIEPYKNKLRYTGRLLHGKFIMNIRISMLRDIEKLRFKSGVLDKCVLIYSLWEGYKEDEEYKKFLSKIAEMGIDIISLHTSGHAHYTAIRQVIDITKPEVVIPIHTENKQGIKKYAGAKAVILEDMEIYQLK